MSVKKWFSFRETGETVVDDHGTQHIIEVSERFIRGAFCTKQFDRDRAIDSWHRANETTTHANVIFSAVD